MAKPTDEELASVGREWLRVVALAKQEGIAVEHDHVRFRDSDLSIKGGALLGFGGLMLAADLVFLSAAPTASSARTSTAAMWALPGCFCSWPGPSAPYCRS